MFQIGDVVKINHVAPNYNGKFAFVYDSYTDFEDPNQIGVCLVTLDDQAIDTGGWSYKEQKDYLEYFMTSGFEYEFKNAIQLQTDIQNGLLDPVRDRITHKLYVEKNDAEQSTN